MYNRLLNISANNSSSVLLLGPRGTGKTAWVKSKFPDAIYIDLLDFNSFKSLSADPSRLAQLIPPNWKNWILIDEVQRIPELLNEVHRLIEKNQFRFLLTGSSARKLKHKGVNLLAGRALRYNMHPLTAQELGNDFDFERALRFGLLPASVSHHDPKKYLTTYVDTYLREEVLQEGLTRNINIFAQFLETASFSQGSLLNTAEISREIGLARQTINDYFAILEDILIAYRIPSFTRRAKRRLVTHNKFYFFDAGAYNIIRPRGPLDTDNEIAGAALETIFLQSFLAINDYLSLGYKIYFWRTSNGQEVDFIAYGEKGLLAFEIKHTKHIATKTLRGLKAFSSDYPEAKLFLFYLGTQREYHENINVIPMENALRELPYILGSNGIQLE